MMLKEYFDKLPNHLSANFFAMIGFTNFMFPVFGMLATYFHLYILKDTTVSQNVMEIFLATILFFIPVVCIVAIIPTIILFIFLIFTKLKNKILIMIIFFILLILYLINPFYKAFHFNHGAGIFFAFVPFFGFPIVMLTILAYLALLLIDLKIKNNCIKNKELVENKYYKIFVNVFYYYFVITLLIDFFMYLCFFFTM